ncbi:hypothetical protein ACWGST_08040, partial [Agromyces sp. NPDC055520]
LARVRLRHSNILPARPEEQANSDVTYSCSRPNTPLISFTYAPTDEWKKQAPTWEAFVPVATGGIPIGIAFASSVRTGNYGLFAAELDPENAGSVAFDTVLWLEAEDTYWKNGGWIAHDGW